MSLHSDPEASMLSAERVASDAEDHSGTPDDVARKIREAVAAAGWDALVVLGVENAQYCSGAWVPMARGYLDRPNIVVWPRDGDPTLILGAELIESIRPKTRIQHLVGYDERGAFPPSVIVDTLADVLQRGALAEGLIGLEMLRTSSLFFNRLAELLPGARFESADRTLHELRMVKTPEEIETMTRGARLTDDGIWQAFVTARAGNTERELASSIHHHIFANKCDMITYLLLGVGDGARGFFAPTDRPLKAGQIVRLDLNSVYGGYFADIGRMAVVGEPTSAQRRAYAEQIDLKLRILDYIRPGRSCSDVHAFYRNEAEKLGVKLFIYYYIGVGHGIGVNADEWPKLNYSDDTALEPGMILNIEPDTIGPEGEVFHVEDMVLVTEDGSELISASRDWSEIPVIALN